MPKAPEHTFAKTLKTFKTASGKGQYFSLPELAKQYPNVAGCRCRSASCWSRCCATATARR